MDKLVQGEEIKMIKDDVSELQVKVKELENKINILSGLIGVDLELELNINRRKKIKRLNDRFE